MMLGGGSMGQDQQEANAMANAQVISSFVQFGFVVGLLNLGN